MKNHNFLSGITFQTKLNPPLGGGGGGGGTELITPLQQPQNGNIMRTFCTCLHSGSCATFLNVFTV